MNLINFLIKIAGKLNPERKKKLDELKKAPYIDNPNDQQMNLAGVYLIHIGGERGEGFHHAQHYIGYADNILNRINEHKKSGFHASPLLKAVNEKNIPWKVVRIWPNQSRQFERDLKNYKVGGGWWCPICREKINAERALRVKLRREKEKQKIENPQQQEKND